MSDLAREELVTRVRALSEEERELVIDNLPVEDLLEGLKRAYLVMSVKCDAITKILEN